MKQTICNMCGTVRPDGEHRWFLLQRWDPEASDVRAWSTRLYGEEVARKGEYKHPADLCSWDCVEKFGTLNAFRPSSAAARSGR